MNSGIAFEKSDCFIRILGLENLIPFLIEVVSHIHPNQWLILDDQYLWIRHTVSLPEI